MRMRLKASAVTLATTGKWSAMNGTGITRVFTLNACLTHSGCRKNFCFFHQKRIPEAPSRGNNSCIYLKRMFETLWMLEKMVFLLTGACLQHF